MRRGARLSQHQQRKRYILTIDATTPYRQFRHRRLFATHAAPYVTLDAVHGAMPTHAAEYMLTLFSLLPRYADGITAY